jgi:hypothetical protein
MNDSTYTILLAGACGLGLLCLVALGIGLAVVSGVMGGGFLFGRRASAPAPRPVATHRDKPDLRAKAQSVDFDDALMRHSAEAPPPETPGTPLPPPDLGPLPSHSRRAQRSRDYSDDEIFGGILDPDGDGDPEL